jgi:hypothetical protein
MVSRWRFGLAWLGLAGLLLSSGCSFDSGKNSDLSGEQVEGGNSDGEEVELELPEGVTAHGVLLAAYLLTHGDIARAVEEALVSPAEVDVARDAIANGSLQGWVDKATKQAD